MIIHFFKERIKERIDFGELIDGYFAQLTNCVITNDDQEVKITKRLDEFDYDYSYLITKRSRVSSIYRLNASYININLLIEIPALMPSFISRLIFKEIGEICEKFELAIFCDRFTNIKPFDMFELITSLSGERLEYLQNHPEVKTYKVPMNKLNEMCRYQSSIKSLPQLVKGTVFAEKYTILVDNRSGEVKNCLIWKMGLPSIFPPHLDYIEIEEENSVCALIPAQVFYKFALGLMSEIKNPSIDYKLLYLNDRGAIKCGKRLQKMKKAVVSMTHFDVININDLMEC